jgi:predicted MPP superfamily phosphohydrolase
MDYLLEFYKKIVFSSMMKRGYSWDADGEMTRIIAAVGSLGLNDSGWGGSSYSRVSDLNRSWDLGLAKRIEFSGAKGVNGLRSGYFFIPTLIFIANFYLYTWIVRLTQPPARLRRTIFFGLFFLLALFPVSRVWAVYDFNSLNRLITFVAATWMGFSFLLVLGAAGTDLVRFFLHQAGLSPRIALSRVLYYRRLTAATSIMVCLVTGGYALWEARQVGVTRIEIPLRNLPPDLDGLSLVQLSDIHYGMLQENGRLSDLVRRVNELRPDLVVFTGDLVDGAVSHMEKMAGPLSGLKAREGLFAVMGNHEFYAGANRAEAIMRQAGIRVLRDRIWFLPGGLQILGIDDRGSARRSRPLPDFQRLINGLDPEKPSILLNHQPVYFERSAAAGVGLQLSGHVHGPQLLPMVPLVRLFYPRMRGLFRLGDSYLYVSRGVGTGGPPMRLGSPPEIVQITLRSPKSGARSKGKGANGLSPPYLPTQGTNSK